VSPSAPGDPRSGDSHAHATDVRRIYSGRVITLDEEVARFPDGTTGTLAIVRHPGASAVVPLLDDVSAADPTVLLLKQHRHAAGGALFEIPAGVIDKGEQPDACARRELLEETGCTAERIEHLTTVFTTPGFSDEQIHLFLATGLRPGNTKHESDEFIELRPTPFSEALERIRTGEIRDAKSIVALLYVAGYRLSR